MKTTLIFLFLSLHFFIVKGQISPEKIEVCLEDTIYVPIDIDSIANYQNATSYQLVYAYYDTALDFLGIDSLNTVFPLGSFVFSDSILSPGSGIKHLYVNADNGSQSFFQENSETKTFITLMFKSNQGLDTISLGHCSFSNDSLYLNTHQIYQRIKVHDNKIKISNSASNYFGEKTVVATKYYNNYHWTYQKKYDWNVSYDNFYYEDSHAIFNGNGIYSVTATDEYGCKLSDEQYLLWDSLPAISVEAVPSVFVGEKLSVNLNSRCANDACALDGEEIEHLKISLIYEPSKLNFDKISYDNTIFPENYFSEFDVQETIINEFTSLIVIQMYIIVMHNTPEYINYDNGNFIKVHFNALEQGETVLELSEFEINGIDATVAPPNHRLFEILPSWDSDTLFYAKGTVSANGITFPSGKVISYQKNGNQYYFVSETEIEFGNFSFSDLVKGSYIFQAIPNEDAAFISTYYGNTSNVDEAFEIRLENCEGVVDLNIDLQPLNSMSITSGVNENFPTEKDEDLFSIFPNPASDLLIINVPISMSVKKNMLTIIDVMGKEVFNLHNIRNNQSINISNYPQGIYYLKLNNQIKTFIKK